MPNVPKAIKNQRRGRRGGQGGQGSNNGGRGGAGRINGGRIAPKGGSGCRAPNSHKITQSSSGKRSAGKKSAGNSPRVVQNIIQGKGWALTFQQQKYFGLEQVIIREKVKLSAGKNLEDNNNAE